MSTTSLTTVPRPTCPGCRTGHVVRNGLTHSGTPGFLCRACGRRFVEAPLKVPVSEGKEGLVLRLLGERMAIRAIARVTGLSRPWLQRFVNAPYREGTPREPGPLPQKDSTW
jgi:insertion element IS1 protein InsB